MHKEALHILNNDHTFGITDKGKTRHYKHINRNTHLEKLYIYIVKKETDHGTGSETY
jgi:hypothetical protein